MSRARGLWAVLAGSMLAVPMEGAAQTVPTGIQEYYLTGHAEQLNDMLSDYRAREGANLFPTPRGMNAVTTLTATTDIQIVIYDHWEDGYEPDALNPIQTSTLVLGDGDTGNGDAQAFGGLSGDRINANSVLTWISSDDTGQPGTINDYIPYPRPTSPLALRYDAPDRVVIIGGPVNLVHAEEPRSPHAAEAWRVYPRQLMGTTTEYFIPIGENLYSDGGHFAPFQYVYLQLVSYADSVNITVNNGVTSVTFQLDEGDSWSSLGKINLTAVPASALQIRSGTTVSASGSSS